MLREGKVLARAAPSGVKERCVRGLVSLKIGGQLERGRGQEVEHGD